MKKTIVTLALAALMSVFAFGQNPPAGDKKAAPAGEMKKAAPAKKKRARKKVKKAAVKTGATKPAEKKP